MWLAGDTSAKLGARISREPMGRGLDPFVIRALRGNKMATTDVISLE
jgi:hypothetical protein